MVLDSPRIVNGNATPTASNAHASQRSRARGRSPNGTGSTVRGGTSRVGCLATGVGAAAAHRDDFAAPGSADVMIDVLPLRISHRYASPKTASPAATTTRRAFIPRSSAIHAAKAIDRTDDTAS